MSKKLETKILGAQVSAFGDFKSIGPEPEIVKSCMDAMPGLLPVTNNEVFVDVNAGTVESLPRLCLQKQEKNILKQIEVQATRVISTVAFYGDGEDIDCINAASTEVASFAEKILRAVGTKEDELTLSKLAVNFQTVLLTDDVKPKIKMLNNFPNPISNLDDLASWSVVLNDKTKIIIRNASYEVNKNISYSMGTSKANKYKYGLINGFDFNTNSTDDEKKFLANDIKDFVSLIVENELLPLLKTTEEGILEKRGESE